MYDIDFDSAADQIKGLRKAVKGVQVMCAVKLISRQHPANCSKGIGNLQLCCATGFNKFC
jgi:hypothetical protein